MAVVVSDGRYLMIRRAPGILAAGAWCFVGGAIEAGESQPEALTREFREEVDGAIQPVRKLWEFTRSDGKLVLHWWLATWDGRTLTPNPAEVAELRWCTPDEVRRLPNLLSSNRQFLDLFDGRLM